jgi:hypothetical protein
MRRLLLRLLRFEKEGAGIDDPNRDITIDSTLNVEPTNPMEIHCTEDPEIVQSHKPTGTNSESSTLEKTYSSMASTSTASASTPAVPPPPSQPLENSPPSESFPDSDVALASLTPSSTRSQPGPTPTTGFDAALVQSAVYRTDRGYSTMEKPDSEKTSSDSESAERPTVSRELPKLLNEHELLIAPNEHSIVDDALLRCTPYTPGRRRCVGAKAYINTHNCAN